MSILYNIPICTMYIYTICLIMYINAHFNTLKLKIQKYDPKKCDLVPFKD